MSRKFILEVDHMSKRTLDDTLQLAVQHQYPLIGGHTGLLDVSLGSKRSEAQKTREQMNTIYRLGGMVGVITEQGKSAELATVRPSIPHDCGYSSKSWAQMYLYGIQLTGGAPVAIATDFNGFAGQPALRFGDEACNGDKLARQTGGVHYPFSIVGGNGAKLDRSVIGHKNVDYNYDGLAYIGMVPDFIQDLRSMGVTDNDLKPLFRSAEALHSDVGEDPQPERLSSADDDHRRGAECGRLA